MGQKKIMDSYRGVGMKKFFRILFCKHEFKTLYNIHGDMINHFNGHRRMNKCIKCGKEKPFGGLDQNCRRVNGVYNTNELIIGIIELKILDCKNELDKMKNECYFVNLTKEDKLGIELRKEYLKGKTTALEQILELMKVSV